MKTVLSSMSQKDFEVKIKILFKSFVFWRDNDNGDFAYNAF